MGQIASFRPEQSERHLSPLALCSFRYILVQLLLVSPKLITQVLDWVVSNTWVINFVEKHLVAKLIS